MSFSERFKKQLDFIIELDKLKTVLRQSLLMDASRNENDAEHSWHMAAAALVFAEYSNEKDLDFLKLLKMIIIHDIVEIYAGDTFAYSANYDSAEKYEREKKALEKLLTLLPPDQRDEISDIWFEFEDSLSAEAKFAKSLDRFMPVLHNYITEGVQWKKHGVTKDMVLKINKSAENGSLYLWECIKEIADDSENKGYFKE